MTARSFEAYTPAQMIEALQNAGGVYADAAKQLGCARSTVKNYVDRHPEIREALIDMVEENLDMAESKLMEAVKRGDSWAICFYLKCQGKGRGYVERRQITGKNDDDNLLPGQARVTVFALPDNGRKPTMQIEGEIVAKNGAALPAGALGPED